MARPQKCGMDYFPHDTDSLSDEKIEALRMLYGNDGYAFYFILLERIYRTENFELDISDAETKQILSRKIGVAEELFDKMLLTALKQKCFDKEIYESIGCLTSKGIKKRAEVVISKRVASKKSYNLMVSATETTQETHTESTQSKGKESKVDNKNIDDIELFFKSCWEQYPRKEGLGRISEKTKKERFKLGDSFKQSIVNYKNKIVQNKIEKQFIMQGSTFWNSGYLDYLGTSLQNKVIEIKMIDREVGNE